ncbi:MAG: arsenate reductase ArsC [Candidatus Methanofastidiosum sp.]|nr:arsenate reductase ArsC [Methanofastidiosum sp.]
MKKRILFICTHNANRSQIAEGFVNSLYPDLYEAYSGGMEPTEINPMSIKVMKEIGIDMSKYKSKGIEGFLDKEFDYVVMLCDSSTGCPFFPGGKEYIHMNFEDPSLFNGDEETKLASYRKLRDGIGKWIKETFINSKT